MNVILHCDEYAPHWGPCTVRLKTFSDMLQARNNHVSVLASATNLENKVGEINTVYCLAIKMKRKTAVYRLGNNLSYALTSLLMSCKAGSADVVITTSPPPLISITGWAIAKFKHAKLVYDVRDIWPDVALEMGSFTENSLYCKVFRKIAKFMYRHADLITTVSPGKVEKIRSYLPENERSKVRLLENGLDETFLSQEIDVTIKERYGMGSIFTCVYIGNIGLAQGLTHLLDLAETVKNEKVQFLLFGNGAEKDRLEQEATRRGLGNVHFEGVIDIKTVFSVLKFSQLAYIPLVNANLKDSIPTKTYEALGAGCPVLMVAEGDAPKLVEECKLGRTLSPNEIDKLPQLFKEIRQDYDDILEYRNYAREQILTKHSRQKIALQLEQMLLQLASEECEDNAI